MPFRALSCEGEQQDSRGERSNDGSPEGRLGWQEFASDEVVGSPCNGSDRSYKLYAQHDLLEGEFDVLATLRRLGDPFETSAGRLAAQTMVTTGAMSKRLDRLERAGLVTRRVSGVDGRGRVIALTEKGRAIIDAAFTDHVANEHRLVEAMSADDRLALAGILGRWSTRLEQSLPAGS